MADRVTLAEQAVMLSNAPPLVQAALEAILNLARHAEQQSRAAAESATKAEQVVHIVCENIEAQLDQMRRDLW